MEHVVFFPAQDGSPAFRRVRGLDEAVRLVEHLRNVEGVAAASLFALTEVPLSFRAYYRVEVPGLSSPGLPEPAVDALVPSQAPEADQELLGGSSPAGPATSLGFFA